MRMGRDYFGESRGQAGQADAARQTQSEILMGGSLTHIKINKLPHVSDSAAVLVVCISLPNWMRLAMMVTLETSV